MEPGVGASRATMHRYCLLLTGPKSSFYMKLYFAFYLEIKILASEEIWKETDTKVLRFIKSKINVDVCQRILKHFMLPSARKFYGDANFL